MTQSIDSLVESAVPSCAPEILYLANKNHYQKDDYIHKLSREYSSVEMFLSPIRPVTQFINEAWMVKDYIIEGFQKLTGRDFPKDIIVKVCDKEMIKSIHEDNGCSWKEGIQGFAINRRPDISQIFIMQNSLDRLMLVIGHELGHVLSDRLPVPHDEEAKAFAFELAWAEIIKKHNIAGLGDCITTDIRPAKNGLHDVAWNFVLKLMNRGMDSLEIYSEIIRNKLRVSHIV